MCIKDGLYYKFFKYFEIYKSNVRCHFENLSLEIQSINDCNSDPTISRNQINKWVGEINTRLNLWVRETEVFLREISLESWRNPLKRWLVKNRMKQLQKAINEVRRPIKK